MNEKKAYIIYLSSMALFGSIGLFVREIPLSSSVLAFVRGILGSGFLILMTMLLKQKISWKNIKLNLLLLIFAGIAVAANWIFLFEAYRYTTIANATLSYYFAPVFMVIASFFLFKDAVTFRKILSILLAMVGMFLIVGGDMEGGTHLIGILAGLTAALFYATVVMLNKFLKNISGLDATIVQLMIASIAIMPYTFLTNTVSFGDLTTKTVVLTLIVGIVHTGVGYFMYFTSIRVLKAHTIAMNSYIDPVIAIFLSILLLSEAMTPLQGLGAVLILGSTFANQYLQYRETKKINCKP